MKNAEAAISSRGGVVKSLRTREDGLKNFKNFKTGRGLPIWGVTFAGGVSTPLHAMLDTKEGTCSKINHLHILHL